MDIKLVIKKENAKPIITKFLKMEQSDLGENILHWSDIQNHFTIKEFEDQTPKNPYILAQISFRLLNHDGSKVMTYYRSKKNIKNGMHERISAGKSVIFSLTPSHGDYRDKNASGCIRKWLQSNVISNCNSYDAKIEYKGIGINSIGVSAENHDRCCDTEILMKAMKEESLTEGDKSLKYKPYYMFFFCDVYLGSEGEVFHYFNGSETGDYSLCPEFLPVHETEEEISEITKLPGDSSYLKALIAPDGIGIHKSARCILRTKEQNWEDPFFGEHKSDINIRGIKSRGLIGPEYLVNVLENLLDSGDFTHCVHQFINCSVLYLQAIYISWNRLLYGNDNLQELKELQSRELIDMLVEDTQKAESILLDWRRVLMESRNELFKNRIDQLSNYLHQKYLNKIVK